MLKERVLVQGAMFRRKVWSVVAIWAVPSVILKEAPVVEAPVVFTLSMSLSPTFSAMTLCLIDFIGLLGGVVALLETVARFLLLSIAQFS